MPTISMILILLCLIAVNVPMASAQSGDILAPGDWSLSAPLPSDATYQTVQEQDAPGGQELKIVVTNPSAPLWLIQISRGIPADVPTGDVVRLHFWARSATKNAIRVTVEQSVSPFQALCEQNIVLTPLWTEYTLTGQSIGLGPNGISAHFQVGASAGVVEIAEPTVVDEGVDPEIVAAKAALTPENEAARINQYRKGELTVVVMSSDGKPLKDAFVHIKQTRHAFLFGCNFFGLDPDDHSPAQIAYQTEFSSLFNYATLPFYWGAFEQQQGSPDYDRLQAMASWCVAHNITPKGHPLVWHEVWPSWAPSDPDQAIPLLKARVLDLIPRYSSTIRYWDVVNEASNAMSYLPANGESSWIKRDGPATVVGDALDWARSAAKIDPKEPEAFIYNDYETGQPNVALLTALQQNGKLPDIIGIQSHMHAGVWPLTKVWEVCNTFAQFHRPIHFTETTVLSGPSRSFDFNGPPATDWNTDPVDEASQAQYVVQFYTALFSHPDVHAITWWDFSDLNAWLGAPAGLVRKDMTPKPAYTMLMNLIHKTWWTDTTGVSNTKGELKARVFYGDYVITVTDSSGQSRETVVRYPESAPPLTVTVRL